MYGKPNVERMDGTNFLDVNRENDWMNTDKVAFSKQFFEEYCSNVPKNA